jgi:hypothetical protein
VSQISSVNPLERDRYGQLPYFSDGSISGLVAARRGTVRVGARQTAPGRDSRNRKGRLMRCSLCASARLRDGRCPISGRVTMRPASLSPPRLRQLDRGRARASSERDRKQERARQRFDEGEKSIIVAGRHPSGSVTSWRGSRPCRSNPLRTESRRAQTTGLTPFPGVVRCNKVVVERSRSGVKKLVPSSWQSRSKGQDQGHDGQS